MPLHSTGALTPEQHAKQDQRYAENHSYDFVIIGTGVAALTAGALLANAGKKVCLLEAHDIPGGYAHSFNMGDFYFCAQIHYIWGCGEGDTMNQILSKLGLEKELTFEPFDPNGYDHMVMPDGKRVPIPCGWEQLAQNIEKAYPGQRAAVQKFTTILKKLRSQIRQLPAKKSFSWWDYLSKGWRFLTLLKYKDKTLQDVFDECGLSKEAQLVLCANAGDFMSPPKELSILSYIGLFGGYNAGTYYPTKHFKGYIDRFAQFITEHEGCHIYYETPVNKINREGDQVVSVETENGKTFSAAHFICNADPQHTAEHLIGWEHFPADFKPSLQYSYSPAGMVVYLGLKNIDLEKHGFGSFNIWHCTQWDMNQCWDEQLAGNFDKPWFFISTATLHSDAAGVAPEGMHIMEIATLTDYDSFRELKKTDPKKYREKKMALADRLLDLVEEHYIPNLREHIAIKVVGTSSTNRDFNRAPRGNAYGSLMNPQQMGLGRLKAETPWKNFFWCNASSGYPGFYGTSNTGANLYMKLTGDRFLSTESIPSDDELIARVHERWKQHSQHEPEEVTASPEA